jgi:hypothetical protein
MGCRSLDVAAREATYGEVVVVPCAPLPDVAAGAVVVVAFFFGAFLQSSTT